MYITCIGLLISLSIYLTGYTLSTIQQLLVAAVGPFLFTLSPCILLSGVFGPLLKGELKGTPKLIQLVRRDAQLQGAFIVLLALSFLPLLPEKPWAQAALPLMLGIGLDSLKFFANRLLDHLNPFKIISFIEQDAKKAIETDRDTKVCQSIEALGEAGAQALHRHNSALAIRAIDALSHVGQLFLNTEKSLGHPTQNKELQAEGVKDTLSYVFLLILQHLESLYSIALEKKQELVLNHLITALTEMAIKAAHVDLTLVILPLHYIKNLSRKAIEQQHIEIGVKTGIGLMELAKEIARLKDLAYLDIKPTYHLILNSLDGIAQATFKLDKTSDISLLVQPIRSLQTLFNEGPLKDHQDAPIIQKQITTVLSEFQVLDTLMKTIPPLPNLSQEEGQQKPSP